MKDSLLVCIAFHASEERFKYLREVMCNLLNNYDCPIKIIIDTNMLLLPEMYLFYQDSRVETYLHDNLDHPFHLTCIHRQRILDNIDKYDVFAYFEDDMVLPYGNYLNYIENFKLMWPSFVPSFIRIEKDDKNDMYVTDITKPQKISQTVKIDNREFTTLLQPYHAFWIMPQKELKTAISTTFFTRLHDSRETSASFPMYELHKRPLIEIENNQVIPLCYSYHIANNYVRSKETPFAKIKPENIFL